MNPYFYIIECTEETEKFTKFGVARDVKRRCSQLSKQHINVKFVLKYSRPVVSLAKGNELELCINKRFKGKVRRGREWLDVEVGEVIKAANEYMPEYELCGPPVYPKKIHTPITLRIEEREWLKKLCKQESRNMSNQISWIIYCLRTGKKLELLKE